MKDHRGSHVEAAESLGVPLPTPDAIAGVYARTQPQESTTGYSLDLYPNTDSWSWELYSHTAKTWDMLDAGYATTQAGALAAAGRALIRVGATVEAG